MKSGNRIRVPIFFMGHSAGYEDYIVEEFRHCLGFFRDEDHRKAGRFTPLCEVYERGPDSKEDYISNFGSYITNMVQGWSDLPS